ncbi:MAG TPA: 3-deoxy-D-manno-octulosonic acid transferase [Terracidiphilus sp.]|jgi:3-deoxy-D-manno-octulosonic-acid transferase|nr:3-deoxy-D-manno-octulosonic acid transferase [Terracidiphilus sp.]
MILSVYNLALLILLVAGLPFWIIRVAATRKYREGLVARLGFVPRRLRQPSDPRPVLWLHAVSVGEVLAISRLVAELDRALTGYRILVSTTTRTGQALARERFGPERVFYCPLDLPWAIRAYLNALRPALLILAETEFWPNLLAGCRHRGIPVAVVNARISDRSWPRYRRLRNLWTPFLSELALVLAQTETDADRLRALGCRPERLSVAGNLKFDVRVAREAEATRLIKACASRTRFLVAGSTLDGEESALLTVFQDLAVSEPSLVLVLAPRHPERFASVASLVTASGFPLVRRSAWKNRPPEMLAGGQVVLLDSIGELASVYSLAAVAFVGGSLVPAGGHNPLEPAQFGVPIVIGPHYANFRAVTDDLLGRQALRIANREQLQEVVFHLLYDHSDASAMGKRARQAFEEQSGATARCVEAIAALLASNPIATPALESQP